MLCPGDTAPDFELTDADGAAVRLSDLLREGPVVVAFYPADSTPVCTAQNCMMRDTHDRLTRAGYRVVSISPQGSASKARFRDAHGLTQTMLADPDRAAIRGFGVSGPLGVTRRATFLVGADGKITDRAVADLRVGPHRKLLERAAAQAGDDDSSAG